MRRLTLRVAIGLVLLVGLTFAYGPVRQFLAVDTCLDHGGAWDHQHQTCDVTGSVAE